MFCCHSWRRLLLAWVVLCALWSGAAGAQEPAPLSAEVAALDAEIEQLWQQVQSRRNGIEAIEQQYEAVPTLERPALARRIDDHQRELLKQVNELVQLLGQRAAQGADISHWHELLWPQLEQAAPKLQKQLMRMRERRAAHLKNMGPLSGVEAVAAIATLARLTEQLDSAYKLTLQHIHARETLQIETAELRDFLTARLLLDAELLSGDIALLSREGALLAVQLRQEPGSADVKTVASRNEAKLSGSIERLTRIVGMLKDLGTPVDDYQALLLQHTTTIRTNLATPNALEKLAEKWWDDGVNWLMENGAQTFFSAFFFVVVLLLFHKIAKLTSLLAGKALNKSHVRISLLLKNMIVSVTYGIITIVGLLVALSQLGISLAPMLAGLGVVGFVIGFALQDTLGNFASGFMILLYRPYDEGDYIEVAGVAGTVRKMNLVSTTIATIDNQTLVIPNNKIWGGVIKNVTAQYHRRVDMVFGISYRDDVDHAERVLKAIVAEHPKVLKDPEPIVRLHELGESSVNFVVRPWTPTADYWEVYWDITREVKRRFDAEGISIPFPQREVHVFTHGDQPPPPASALVDD